MDGETQGKLGKDMASGCIRALRAVRHDCNQITHRVVQRICLSDDMTTYLMHGSNRNEHGYVGSAFMHTVRDRTEGVRTSTVENNSICSETKEKIASTHLLL